VLGLALHHQVNQFRHLLIVVSARAPGPQFVVQTSNSALLITAAPVAKRRSAAIAVAGADEESKFFRPRSRSG
jgi:hypothetical protein